ncbi:glycosyltransferase family 4 protein [uncultured Algibacter sp.]|uniref:glycosyltransferase family 4 protein n=1 Tax=uncultured Algibacter sp. TaxID=298659 RepID=UPI00263967CE|nr:glycosyltransferase family 4 protein [uncultured Algibacter sp.]
MKIGLILTNTPSYSETFFRSKIEGLQAHGHQVILVTAKKDSHFSLCEQLAHPKIYKNKALQLVMMLKVFLGMVFYYKSVAAFYQLEKKEQTPVKRIIEKIYINATLLKLKVNWLHFGFATVTKDRELVARAINTRMAVSFRGYDINVYPLKHPGCYEKLWKYTDAVHSISKDLRQKACALGLPKSTSYQIIPPAVHDKIIVEHIQVKEENMPFEILTIARLHYMKGIDMLIDTAKLLKDEGLNFIWRIVGTGDSQSLKRYKYHIFSLGLEDVVILEGKKTHEMSLKLLDETDFYVQTSYTEGFCNALLEAQAKGKLCLAFNSGGISENILRDRTGVLIDEVCRNALTKGIIETLKLPEEDKINLRTEAIKRVKKEFTLEQQQQAFLKFYRTLS